MTDLGRFSRRQTIVGTAAIGVAAIATNSPAFSSLLYADADKIDPQLMDAHAKGYQAIKAGPGGFPVGVTLSTQQIEAVDENSLAPAIEKMVYGRWWDAVNASDFVGVQTYTRVRLDAKTVVPPPAGAEMTAAGYEYYPAALGATIRYAARHTKKPIYVTETGIATDDDTRRIAWIDETIAQVVACMDEGIDVRSYIYWSPLDNFEWSSGYGQHFGLVSVDRTSFKRTAKPSAPPGCAGARRIALTIAGKSCDAGPAVLSENRVEPLCLRPLFQSA